MLGHQVNLAANCVWEGRRIVGNASVKLIPDWATSTAYAVNDIVQVTGAIYVCAVAHTSGTFATDNAAGNWTALSGGFSGISLSAPTNKHTKAAQNTDPVLVGINSTNGAGGHAISNTDYKPVWFYYCDPTKVTLTGTTGNSSTGDEVEVQLFQIA